MIGALKNCESILGICQRVGAGALSLAVLLGSVALVSRSAEAQTLTVLHSFTGGDGANPEAGLIRDAAGNSYGTTNAGGAHGYGTVFKVDTANNETVLHSFTGADGANPAAGLIRDGEGNLYGTTARGGAHGYGTVFKVDAANNETVLHSFGGYPVDGANPYADLIRDAAGNFYGTTSGRCGTMWICGNASRLWNCFQAGRDGHGNRAS